MFLKRKCLSIHHIFNNNFLKSFLILSSVLAFLIFVITYIKTISTVNLKDSASNIFQTNTQNFSTFKSFLIQEFQLKSKIKFDNEKARIIGFPVKTKQTKKNSTRIIYLATKYFNEWNPKHYYFLHFGNETFIRYPCQINDCYVTNNPSDIQKAHALLFHVRDLEIFSIPLYRSPEQIWILYSMEPPWLEIKDMRRFNGLFNWTMSYRRNSDVSVVYGFIGSKPADSKESMTLFSHNRFEQKIDKAVWYVSNCQTDSNREEYVKRLKKVYPVDVLGGCGIEGCRPAELKKCYLQIAKHYKFYLAFENAICRDYVTEKLYNPLEYHIIPVTLGGMNYSNITPENSIINAMDFLTPEELGQYLWKVSQNKTLYMSYFAWKNAFRSYLQPWMCDLCEKLHSTITPKTHDNLESWWNEGNSCLRWTTNGLKPITAHAFPQYHTKLFA